MTRKQLQIWAILKTFVNGSKIQLIPPLQVDNKLLTDFLNKASLFNNFFAEKERPISNNSIIKLMVTMKFQYA